MKRLNTQGLCLLVLLVSMLFISELCNAQNTRLPYFNGFENASDTAGWTFKKRARTTGFEVGTATHCLGYKSMYISPDSGATATYVTTPSGYASIAYKSFTLPAGTYQLAFDYQLGGDGTNQDMKVAWVPSSANLVASSLGSFPSAVTQYQFTDNTSKNTFGIAAWTHVTGTVTVPAGGGTYNLCFAFRSNSTTVSAPGACVDNIQLDTVKGNSDCTKVPTNIVVTKDAQAGVIITWSGNATQYEVVAASASDPLDNSYCEHTGITTTSDTMQYSELGEGQYFFYVRAICDSDTSMYGEISGVLIYDVSAHCIDFITFNASGTQCTYGNYDNPYQTNGYIDNGSSQMSSRHTVHTDLNEMDARTNGALHTVPSGDVMSVRLGNWNDGAEAESITYTYNVPTGSSLILMLKYAIVFEEPGHSEPPEFKLEIMNSNMVLLDAVCTKANFLCDGTLTQGWHSCTYTGGGYGTTVWWKDWTTIGVNLTQYAGQTIKVRLTTYDCSAYGHFGYAYFTLGCQNAEFTGMSCGAGESTEIKAPDGFNYSWRNNCTGQIVSTAQALPIAGTDTCSYTCTCSFKENASCSFTLTAYTIPRLPESKFTYTVTYSDCQTHINFTNTSEVYMVKDGVKTYLPNEKITSQTWSVATQHRNRTYYNKTSGSKNLSQLDIPKEGDTIDITLTSWSNGCDDDTVVRLYVPALKESYGLTNRYVCKGTPVSFNQKSYTFVTRDSIEVKDADGNITYIRDTAIHVIDTLPSWCGCDSILELKVKALITDTTQVDTSLCSGSSIRVTRTYANDPTKLIIDTVITQTGNYAIHGASSLGCDSLLLLYNVTIQDTLGVTTTLLNNVICADDASFSVKFYITGEITGYRISYDKEPFVYDTTFQDLYYKRDSTKKIYYCDTTITFYMDIQDDEIAWSAEDTASMKNGKYVRPDNYVATVTIYNKFSNCRDAVLTIPFTVQYPMDVIAQRWNDFLGVRNKEYNGGYDFVEFQWYIDGVPVQSHVASTSQYYVQGQDLDTTKRYSVALKRANENYFVTTCEFHPQSFSQKDIDEITVTLSGQGSQTASQQSKPARAQLYNSFGVLIGTYDFEEGVNYFDTPSNPGVYVMVYNFEDGSRESVKFVVK